MCQTCVPLPGRAVSVCNDRLLVAASTASQSCAEVIQIVHVVPLPPRLPDEPYSFFMVLEIITFLRLSASHTETKV